MLSILASLDDYLVSAAIRMSSKEKSDSKHLAVCIEEPKFETVPTQECESFTIL
jgi:hypothetical protein